MPAAETATPERQLLLPTTSQSCIQHPPARAPQGTGARHPTLEANHFPTRPIPPVPAESLCTGGRVRTADHFRPARWSDPANPESPLGDKNDPSHRQFHRSQKRVRRGPGPSPASPRWPRRSRTVSPLHGPEKVRGRAGTAGYKSVPARRRDKSARLLRHVPCVGQVQHQPPGWLNPREPQQPGLATTLPGPGPLPGRQRSKSSATTPIPPGAPGLCHAIRQEVVSEACSGNTGRTYSPAAP